MEINYDIMTFISKYLYFRPRGVNLAEIIKVATIFIKAILKDSKKVKRIRN